MSPFLGSYYALTSKGSLSNDYQNLMQGREYSRNRFNGIVDNLLSVNKNDNSFKYTRIASNAAIDAYFTVGFLNLGYKVSQAGYQGIKSLGVLKSLKNQSSGVNNSFNMMPVNRLYSGIDIENVVGNFKKTVEKKPVILKPNSSAVGAHSTFKTVKGKVIKYTTFKPQTNFKNPNPWEVLKRYDGNPIARHMHHNKFLEKDICTPHIHDSTFPGEVRCPLEWEIPK